jgi:WD40 repeat protein
MRSDNITRTPAADEDAPPRPRRVRRWTAKSIADLVAGVLVGGLFGSCLLGGLIGAARETAMQLRLVGWLQPRLVTLGLVVGGAGGAALALRRFFRQLGRGIRVSDRDLPLGPPNLPGRPARPGRADTRLLARRTDFTLSPFVRPPSASRLVGHHGRITALAVSADGRLALSAGKDRTVSLWDVQTGFELRSFTAFGALVRGLAFSPDGRLLAAAGTNGLGHTPAVAGGGVRVWDAESGQELRRIDFEGTPCSLAFLPDGQQVLVGDIDYLRVWELDGPTPVALFPFHGGVFSGEEVRALAVSADGRLALAGCYSSEDFHLVNLERGEAVRGFCGHGGFHFFRRGAVVGVAFSPDGLRALSGSWDKTARVWNLLTGQELARFDGHRHWWGWRGVVGVAWLGDDRAVSASEDGKLCVWDARTGEELARHHHGAGVTCLAATPDGRLALTGGRDGVVRVWEPASTLQISD